MADTAVELDQKLTGGIWEQLTKYLLAVPEGMDDPEVLIAHEFLRAKLVGWEELTEQQRDVFYQAATVQIDRLMMAVGVVVGVAIHGRS